jgi:hypothetical protein
MFHSSMVCSVSSKVFSETSSALDIKLIAFLAVHGRRRSVPPQA